MTTKPGDRVGALISFNDGICEFLGYGVYEGEFELDDSAVGDVADITRTTFRHAKKLLEEEGLLEEVNDDFLEHVKNPRILLDSGERVWGCECWWAPEQEMMERLEGATLIEKSITDLRRQWAAQKNEMESNVVTEGAGR